MSIAVVEKCWEELLKELHKKLPNIKPEQEERVQAAFLLGATAGLSAALSIEIQGTLLHGADTAARERSEAFQKMLAELQRKMQALGSDKHRGNEK